MKNAVVIDLDGCLCNVEHRRHLVPEKGKRDYDAFHALLHLDSVNEWCYDMMLAFDVARYELILVSARPLRYEHETRFWLGDNGVPYHELNLLRGENDSTPAVDLKRQWVKSFGAENIAFAIDDNPKIAKMFREEGVICLQCA